METTDNEQTGVCWFNISKNMWMNAKKKKQKKKSFCCTEYKKARVGKCL